MVLKINKRIKLSGRKSKQYILWRKAVYKRDNYTCQVCKRTNVLLNAHHIKGYSRHKLLRYSVSNGITLCSKCHRKFHEYYGKKIFPDIRILIENKDFKFLK